MKINQVLAKNQIVLIVGVIVLIVAGVVLYFQTGKESFAPVVEVPKKEQNITNKTKVVVAKTEILASEVKDLRGQAEKVQLADGTICGFINGATMGVKGERLNYGCGQDNSVVIYGDLIEGVVWKANVANLEWDATKKEWNVLSVKVVDIAKLWR